MAKAILLTVALLALTATAQEGPGKTVTFDVASGGVLGSLVTALVVYLNSLRKQRMQVSPDPLNVRGLPPSIKEPLCESKHKAVDERLRENREDHSNIFPRLTDIERRVGILEGTIKEIKEEYHSIDDKLTILLRRK